MLPRKSIRLKKLEKELEKMESIEKFFNWLDGEGYAPQYEEDMALEFWRRKKELEEEIRKMKRKARAHLPIRNFRFSLGLFAISRLWASF